MSGNTLREEVRDEPVSSGRILVVEDEKLVGWSVQKLLHRRGHEVDLATRISAAMDLTDEKEYDLILCDYVFPEGRGDSLFAKIRATRPETKLILMSGALTAEAVQRLKADACLEKPFLMGELEELIDRLFQPGG